jgi:FHA domain
VSCRGVPIASTSSRRLALPAEIELQPPFAIRAFGGQARPRSEPMLTLSGRDEKGRVVEFQVAPAFGDAESTWVIGRREGRVDILLAHRLVSNAHARIRFSRARGLEICDLGSSNGTLLDGRPIGQDYVSLAGVSRVSFGGFEMEVVGG